MISRKISFLVYFSILFLPINPLSIFPTFIVFSVILDIKCREMGNVRKHKRLRINHPMRTCV